MEIKLHEITIRELTAGYEDKGDDGVVAYGSKLDVRPPFQREFVYDDKQRAMVIDTVMKGHPLNVMYWAVRDASTGSATEDSMIIIDYRYRGTHNHRSPIEPPSDMSVLKIQVRKIKSKILVTCKILNFLFF